MDARSLRSDRAVCMLGRRVSIELGLSVVRLPYSSLSAAELDTCLFPSYNRISEDSRIMAKRKILGSRIRVFDTMPRDVKDQCAGFRARPSFTPGFRGFSAYTTCMVGIEHLSGDRKCWTKISDFFYSAIILVSDASATSRDAEDLLFFRMPRFGLEMFAEVDLANHREESAPFNVHDATSILEFSSSQMFSMLFRDLLGTTETERNALKQETFRSRFEGEYKAGGRYVATDSLTGRYVASGSKPRSVLLVFVVKSQRKLRLRRNKKRFDEDSKDNPKEELSEALQVATLTGRYVASGSKPRRVLLVFVVKSQRKLRLRRNEKRFDEDSKENPKQDLSEALQRPSIVRTRSLRSDRSVCVLGRYVATKQHVRARSLRRDRAVCVLGRYVVTEQRVLARSLRSDRAVCVLGRYVATEQHRPSRVRARSLPSDRAVCVLGRYVATEQCACSWFLGEQVLSFQNVFGKRVLVKPLCIDISFVRKRNRGHVLVLFLWRKVATKFSILLNNAAFAGPGSLREPTTIRVRALRSLQEIIRALAAKAVSDLKFLSAENSESKKFSPCLSPRTPYILAPRSVYAFTLLPLHRHSIKWRYSIFSDLRIYPQNFVFIRGNLTFILPCAPSVNRHTVYGLLVKKSMVGRHELSSLRSSGDSIIG
ncbi:hypothetical protein IGI04_035717 [Brassica rapa subsp. trilocularis]|uniref:Uncharacterized protein n=1 Tax=Brassica rapa subsp. trilocularis TaxID=1813537 RepID=A0ABQ7LCC7_BRACM|nr:hypothetical protein IGI04_035717 [Brassica rapa subsp. trilocularis]